MVSRAFVPMEEMALNAAVLPMLIKDRSEVQQNVTMTALNGMFQPGLTYSIIISLLHIGIAERKPYMGKKAGTRQSAISAEGPELS